MVVTVPAGTLTAETTAFACCYATYSIQHTANSHCLLQAVFTLFADLQLVSRSVYVVLLLLLLLLLAITITILTITVRLLLLLCTSTSY